MKLDQSTSRATQFCHFCMKFRQHLETFWLPPRGRHTEFKNIKKRKIISEIWLVNFRLSLNVVTLTIDSVKTYTQKGVAISVTGIAQVRIGMKSEFLPGKNRANAIFGIRTVLNLHIYYCRYIRWFYLMYLYDIIILGNNLQWYWFRDVGASVTVWN